MPPAARIGDPVQHPTPPVLTTGPASSNVIIGGMKAWRGIGGAGAAIVENAKKVSDQIIDKAEKATLAAAGTPAAPGAKATEETVKATAATTMGTLISTTAGIAGA